MQKLGISSYEGEIEDMLFCCAEFVTERESWMLDGEFKVHVDTTDFGHVVGKVKLSRFLGGFTEEREEGEEEIVKFVREEMDREVEAFMISHPQAFPAEQPVGKLSAYFQRVQR